MKTLCGTGSKVGAREFYVYKAIERYLKYLVDHQHHRLLTLGLKGLEKETLRVGSDGVIAQTSHPLALGSALTNPYITTDYSEALAEFITPPFVDADQVLQFLDDTQRFVYAHLNEEILWATSMPCVVPGETGIPIAQYGSSNAGRMKTVYRLGLGYRYGRVMQVIAGVHFNYSVPEALWPILQEFSSDHSSQFVSERYFAMLRNLQRLGWLVPYLFGASPAVCKSFLGGKPTEMESFNATTYYEPFATSLRMGDIGYQNNKENETGIKASYDSLESYVESLTCAINTVYPGYEKIGVGVDGEYRQLNANILQIENEYYSTVRPKQILNGNEKPSLALKQRGVRYLELRSVDVNASHPLGIDREQMAFLEAFMLFCLFTDSPVISSTERAEIDYNELVTAHRGREPGLQLRRCGKDISLRAWANEALSAMSGVCEVLDSASATTRYSDSLRAQREKVADPDATPSAMMLAEMRSNDEGFFQYALRKSCEHRDYFQKTALSQERDEFFQGEARQSLQRQKQIEQEDTLGFSDYLKQYFAQQ